MRVIVAKDYEEASRLAADVIEERDGNIIRYTYKYDKYKFHIECEVDAVQEHNAEDAMLSAWGVVY